MAHYCFDTAERRNVLSKLHLPVVSPFVRHPSSCTITPMLDLGTAVQYVKGIGPRVADALAAKGVFTVEDLLYYLPFRYEDRINPRTIPELRPGEMASVIAEVPWFHPAPHPTHAHLRDDLPDRAALR